MKPIDLQKMRKQNLLSYEYDLANILDNAKKSHDIKAAYQDANVNDSDSGNEHVNDVINDLGNGNLSAAEDDFEALFENIKEM